MYYVYVLQSKLNGQLYVGSANNLKSRFEQHNDGKVTSTRRYKPWKLLYYEAYGSERLARMREKRLKYNGNAIRELKKRIEFSKISSLVKFLKSGAGFTLIELLIVISLIGILAGGLVMAINPTEQIQKAQDTKRKSDLNQIQKALEAYYQDVGKYPPSTIDYKIKNLDGNTVEWGASFSPYMSVLPKDPASAKHYEYWSSQEDGQTYGLFAKLDRGSRDPQVCQRMPDVYECRVAKIFNLKCGGDTICDYGVSSPNTSP